MGDRSWGTSLIMYISPELQAAIAGLFVTSSGFMGWLFRALWVGREDAWKAVVGVTTDFLKEAGARQKLWDDMEAVVNNNTREISELKRKIEEQTAEIRRLKP